MNEETGAEFQVRASEDGRFRLRVPGGSYTIAATCEVFEPQGQPHVYVPSDGHVTFDALLQLPVSGESITIPALPNDSPALARTAGLPLEQQPSGEPRWWTAPFRGFGRLFSR